MHRTHLSQIGIRWKPSMRNEGVHLFYYLLHPRPQGLGQSDCLSHVDPRSLQVELLPRNALHDRLPQIRPLQTGSVQGGVGEIRPPQIGTGESHENGCRPVEIH